MNTNFRSSSPIIATIDGVFEWNRINQDIYDYIYGIHNI